MAIEMIKIKIKSRSPRVPSVAWLFERSDREVFVSLDIIFFAIFAVVKAMADRLWLENYLGLTVE